MSSLSFIVQWLLSSSLLLGAYLLGRRAQQDRRLVPAAIILFLFAIPIPIVASLFPGPDQLREFTSIKYGPPIAAFVEAGEKAFQQSPFKPLGNASEGAAAYAELHLGVKPEGEGGSPGSESNGDQELGFHSQPEALNDSSDLGFKDRSELPNPGQMVSTEAVERNASGSQPKSGGSSLAGTAEVNGRQAENVAISNSVTVMETTRSQALNHTRPQTPEDQDELPTDVANNSNSNSSASLHFCLDTLAVGSWTNMSHVTSEVDQSLVVHTIDRVERGGSSDESSQEGSHMVWDWDPLGVQLCNFSTWGRLESVNLLAHLRGPSSSAGESPANRVEHSGPHRTVSADLAPEEAKESSSLTRIVVAGDSQGRLFALALLLLLRGVNEDELGLFRRKHQDWNATVAEANLCIEFWWAPFASNFTERLRSGGRATDPPDVLITSFGLWHMLYTNDAGDYARGLQELTAALQETYRIPGRSAPLVFWLNSPFLFTEKLNTEAKRTRLTESMLRTYNRAASESGLLLPDGAGVSLDLFRVTESCGDSCAPDGMHYILEVYGLVVQFMLNAIALLRS